MMAPEGVSRVEMAREIYARKLEAEGVAVVQGTPFIRPDWGLTEAVLRAAEG